MSRVCSKCHLKKELLAFYKDKKGKDGHSSQCKECTKTRASQYFKDNRSLILNKNTQRLEQLKTDNPEKYKEHLTKERARNKACRSENNLRSRKWSEKNREKSNKIKTNWAERNPEKVAKQLKQYKDRNKSMYLYWANKRRAQKLKAMPAWLTEEEIEDLKTYYIVRDMLNQTSPLIYTVDHIIPLQGKFVCGLHVPWNLRLVEKSMNERKNNKLIPCLGLDLSASYYRFYGKEIHIE